MGLLARTVNDMSKTLEKKNAAKFAEEEKKKPDAKS